MTTPRKRRRSVVEKTFEDLERKFSPPQLQEICRALAPTALTLDDLLAKGPRRLHKQVVQLVFDLVHGKNVRRVERLTREDVNEARKMIATLKEQLLH